MTKKYNKILICVVVLVALLNIFFFQFCKVSGQSMYPTLQQGNVLLLDKISNNYQRMDVVVIRKCGTLIIKRIIGLPGEKVKIEDNTIFINGVKINDIVCCPTESGLAKDEIVLSQNEYFVLGDNREVSLDSRYEAIGTIKANEIVGEVVCSVFPFCHIRKE